MQKRGPHFDFLMESSLRCFSVPDSIRLIRVHKKSPVPSYTLLRIFWLMIKTKPISYGREEIANMAFQVLFKSVSNPVGLIDANMRQMTPNGAN